MFVLKVSKQLRTFLPTQKSFFFSSFPLDSAILPLVSRYPYHWIFEGRVGSSYSHDRNVVRCLGISL